MSENELRLRQWIRDFGHDSQPPFLRDLEAVLADLTKARRLTAADQDLLAACKALAAACTGIIYGSKLAPALQQARAAIARAEPLTADGG